MPLLNNTVRCVTVIELNQIEWSELAARNMQSVTAGLVRALVPCSPGVHVIGRFWGL